MGYELVIDAGHGGRDPGGGSCNYFLEKDMNLTISMYQYKRCLDLKIPTIVTRSKDIYIGPDTRAKMVKETKAKYCISNHINAGGGQGCETIHSIHSDGALAREIFNSLVACGMKGRRVFTRALPKDPKLDYYFMHRLTGNVSTVIVEYGFADNKSDAEFLKDEWMVLAEATIKAFCRHTGHPYKTPVIGLQKHWNKYMPTDVKK